MPNLTEKELTALEEQLNAEQVLSLKYKMYASQVSDPQIKSKCDQMSAQHQNHYNLLLGSLS